MRIYAGVMVHRCKWCCLVMCWRTSPRSLSCQHLWAHSPALCHAPCPGVTLPASPECPTPQYWGWLWAWLVVVESVDVEVVECVGHTGVRCHGRGCWPRSRSSCWPSSLLMACASLVFDVVGVPAGRGLVCFVSCSRPLPGVTSPASPECPSPLFRGWLWGCRRVDCWWLLSVSMACTSWVFDVVGGFAGRGLGCSGGRFRCRWGWLFLCSRLWARLLAEDWVDSLAVVGVDGVFHKHVR